MHTTSESERQRRERQLLAAIFGEQEETQLVNAHKNDEQLVNQIGALYLEVVEAKGRAGQRGLHCFYCGVKGPFVDCRCGRGQKFGCSDLRTFICKACAEAHCFVAERLREMFAMPIVNRVRSRRERAFSLLIRGCGENVCDGDLHNIESRSDLERLYFYLCQADPIEDTPQQFETRILKAFRRARFLSWQPFVAEYKRQSEDDAIRSILRLGIR